jgi:hypothetical protein
VADKLLWNDAELCISKEENNLDNLDDRDLKEDKD